MKCKKFFSFAAIAVMLASFAAGLPQRRIIRAGLKTTFG